MRIIILASALLLLAVYRAQAQAPGSLDPSFDIGTGFEGGTPQLTVDSVVIQRDNLVVCGNFDSVNGTVAHGVVRLNGNGTPDSSFNVGSGSAYLSLGWGWIGSLALDGDGNHILIGCRDDGKFSGVSIGALIRVDSSGNVDMGYAPFQGRFSSVRSILPVGDGTFFVCGDYLDASRSKEIVHLRADGTLDPNFNEADLHLTGLHWFSACGIQRDGRIVVAGAQDGGAKGVVARLLPDGSLDPSFNVPVGLTYAVSTLKVLRDDRIAIGSGIWQMLPPMTNSSALIVLGSNGKVLTGFPRIVSSLSITELSDGSIIVSDFNALFHIYPDGTLDNSFVCRVTFDNQTGVTSIVEQPDGKLVLGGGFNKVNGVPRKCLVRVFGPEKIPEPLIVGPFKSAEGITVRIQTVTNHVYQLQSTSNLGVPTWTVLKQVKGDGNSQMFADQRPMTNQAFYRIVAR